jgi:hypothetical protein
MKTIVDRIRDLVSHLSDQGFFREADIVELWLENTSEITFDNVNKLEWRDVYALLHADLDYIGEALSDVGNEANEKAHLNEAPSPTVTTPYATCACCDDAALAQIVVDRIVESEAFYIFLATALKGRLRAY